MTARSVTLVALLLIVSVPGVLGQSARTPDEQSYVEGMLLEKAEKYADAISAYTRAKADKNPLLYLRIARCHHWLGRQTMVQQSIRMYQRMVPASTPEALALIATLQPRAQTQRPALVEPRFAELPARGGWLIQLPGGTFKMGSRDLTPGTHSDEWPLHEVTLPSFALDRTEVTVSAYRECIAQKRCTPPEVGSTCNGHRADLAGHPINCVDFYQASAFCAAYGKRLPTEEEWEYAARGTQERTYPWGEEPPGNQVCWLAGQQTCTAGSRPAGMSPFGIHDMAGSLWEWVDSPYCPYKKTRCSDSRRVLRGGAGPTRNSDFLRSTYRHKANPGTRLSSAGFRCAKDLKP